MKTFIVFFIFTNFLISVDYPTSKGKDFYFSWMRNTHKISAFDGIPADSLYLYILADVETSATVTIWDISGNQEEIKFTIPANDFRYVSKPFVNYELGFVLVGSMTNGLVNQTSTHFETPILCSWELKTDNPVNAVILNQAEKTSDACLLYPVDSYGTEYIISSYKNNNTSSSIKSSQFIVVATEDNTNITIQSNENSRIKQTNNTSFVLNKNQAYYYISRAIETDDVSGSIVKSDKKIAVYSGHERALVPDNTDRNSRDYLLEQMPPIDTWGLSYPVVPFDNGNGGIDINFNDINRVIASENNTELRQNGILIANLNKGEFIDYVSSEPALFQADKGIMVTQIKKSFTQGNNDFTISDPFLLVVPSKEQYLNEYLFIMPNPKIFFSQVFDKHYITILTEYPNASFVLDGIPQNYKFDRIDKSTFYFTNVELAPGLHQINSPENFGLYVYGYGEADSYGFVGGLGFNATDKKAPDITSIRNCYKINGTISDNQFKDLGLASVILLEQNNISFDYDSLTTLFSIELIDKTKDGLAIIECKDLADNLRLDTFSIAGQTLQFDFPQGIDEILVYNKIHCFTYQIYNNGKFPKNLDYILKQADNIISINIDKNILEPNDSTNIEICFNGIEAEKINYEMYYNLLTFRDTCEIISNLNLLVQFFKDESKPNILNNDFDSCNQLINIKVEEKGKDNIGFGAYNKLIFENFDVVKEFQDDSITDLTYKVSNPYQDAFLNIEISDLANNSQTFSWNIPGFTIDFAPDNTNGEAINFNDTYCYDFELFNYGSFDFIANDIKFANNYFFNIPLSQLPIVIPPGESKKLNICVSDRGQLDLIVDSLIIEYNCLKITKEVKANAKVFEYDYSTRCNIDFVISRSGYLKPIIDPLYENPNTDGIIKQKIYSPFNGFAEIQFIDLNGNPIFKNNIEVKENYISNIKINVSDLESGIYYMILKIGEEEKVQKVMLNK